MHATKRDDGNRRILDVPAACLGGSTVAVRWVHEFRRSSLLARNTHVFCGSNNVGLIHASTHDGGGRTIPGLSVGCLRHLLPAWGATVSPVIALRPMCRRVCVIKNDDLPVHFLQAN